MNRIYLQILLVFFLFLVAIIGCEDSLTSTEIDRIIIPDKNVSFNEYIQPVFNVKCSNSGCHDDATRAGDYSVTNWANVVTPGVVDPGNVETSRLVWRIEGLGVEPMPPLGSIVPPLTKNQIDGVKTWIKEGAQYN